MHVHFLFVNRLCECYLLDIASAKFLLIISTFSISRYRHRFILQEAHLFISGISLSNTSLKPFFYYYVLTNICTFAKCGAEDKPATQVIELSDDDDEEEGLNDTSQRVDNLESKLWYYTDPQGIVQGPFSMVTLKKWYDDLYFFPGFKIWKTGGVPVLLKDVISLMFPS